MTAIDPRVEAALPELEETGVGTTPAEGTPAADDPDLQRYTRETLDKIHLLKQESRQFTTDADAGSFSIEQELSHNASRFLGNMDIGRATTETMEENYRSISNLQGGSYTGLKRAQLMRTQQSIMSNTASSLASPVHGRIDPVEIGEEDVWFLTPRGGRIVYGLVKQLVQQQIQTQLVAAQQAADTADAAMADQIQANLLTEETAEQAIMDQQFAGLQLDQLMGDPPENGPAEPLTEEQFEVLQPLVLAGQLKDSDFIAITDKFIAQRVQEVCDLLTDAHQMGLYWMVNELNCNIFGFMCGSFDWFTEGENRHNYEFDNIHPLNIFTDPSHMDLKRRSYHIEDRIQNLQEALHQHPDHAESLRSVAVEGRQMMHREADYELSGLSDNVEYGRKMVRITMAWLRHEQVPASPVEAVEEGLVIEVPEGVDPETGAPTPGGFTLPDGTPVEPQQQTRHGTPWPNVVGLRQVVVCEEADIILQDVRCPHWDIPRIWNVNIPRPDMSPFGQGEPVRLRNIDQIINRTVTIIVNHLAMLPFSTYFWPADVLESIRQHGVGIHLRPNTHVPIPRSQWEFIVQNGGFDKTRHNAPAVPTEVVNLLQMFLSEHDNASGNVDVRQGRAPYSGASGKTISELREASETSLSIKSMFLEFAAQRFYKLLIHAVLNFMPEHKWAKMLNRYKLPVIREVIKRAALPEWNITVKISSGSGQDEQFQQDRALLMYDRGLKSPESTMEALGEDDPQQEMKRLAAAMAPADASEMGAMTQGGGAPIPAGPEAATGVVPGVPGAPPPA